MNNKSILKYIRLVFLILQTDEAEVINFLLTTEIIPLCLRIMESGSELSKTVATFILQKILLDETGLSYICQTYERFSHVAMILVSLVISFNNAFLNTVFFLLLGISNVFSGRLQVLCGLTCEGLCSY